MTLSSPHSAGPRSHDFFFVRVPPGCAWSVRAAPRARGRAPEERRAVRERTKSGLGMANMSHVEEWGEKDDPYGLIALIKIKLTHSLLLERHAHVGYG